MAIPGIAGYVTPDVYSRVRTLRRATSIPGGLRIPAVMGLGESTETLVLSALGGGQDGENPDFSGSNTPDGRHFQISKTDLIAKRTTVLLNDVPLAGVEETITTQAFNSRYDYRLEPDTGRLELQRASIRDQGGFLAKPGTSNVGNGFDLDGASTLELIDANAPAETWTLRVTSTILDAYGDPISGNATFTVTGSVSGTILDAYGAPVVFISDGVTRDNGILRVSIVEGATPFERNDRFTIIVDSRVLKERDRLEVRMIATQDLNDPEYFTDPNALFLKHGTPSTDNTLSLGAALAFENGAPGVLALQAKPPISRRTSEVLLEANDPLTDDTEGLPQPPASPVAADLDYFKYSIEDGVPDSDTAINIFVIDADSGDETQIFPNKFTFYSSTIGTTNASQFTDFVDNAAHTFEYTVILEAQVEDDGNDGQVASGSAFFTAASASFRSENLDTAESDVGKQIRILPLDKFGAPVSAAGTYTITAVGGGVGDATIVTLDTTFGSTSTDLLWELIDSADESAKLLLTKDIITNGTIGRGDGLRISYIDQDDADFFDANWAAAYEALEATDCQIVVPLPNQAFSNIAQAGKTHVELMSSTANKKERLLFTGAQTGVTAQALLGNELVAVEDVGVLEGVQGDDAEEVLASNIEDLQNFDVADNFGDSFRVVYFYPDSIVRVISGTNTNIPGYYIAAAAAGRLAGTSDVSIPLTNRTLNGFTILRSKVLRPSVLNSLGNNGVCVLQPVTGGGKILHGKTTTSSAAPEEEEISVVFIRDKVAQTMRDVLRGFIGQPEDATLASAIASRAVGVLTALQAQNLITTFQDVNVVRDEVDPRQWNITCEVRPNYPVNWVFIDVTIGAL